MTTLEMETLDNFLKSELDVDLEADKQEGERKQRDNTTSIRMDASRESESFTNSLLRGDVVAPNIVQFAHNNTRIRRLRTRRMCLIVVVLVLSLSGLWRFFCASYFLIRI